MHRYKCVCKIAYSTLSTCVVAKSAFPVCITQSLVCVCVCVSHKRLCAHFQLDVL